MTPGPENRPPHRRVLATLTLVADDERALPPISWFRSPGFTAATPHTVDQPVEIGGVKYRRVSGHLATWDTTHVGHPGRNVRPPRSPSDYARFHTGSAEVADDDGNPIRIPAGHLTCDTGHAGLEASAEDAAKFYDNTGTLAASVCMGEDPIGIWYSGVVEPELPELTLRRFSSCSQSGDWRSTNGGPLDLVASLSVITPGFPIPQSRVASGAPHALVAAGVVPNPAAESAQQPDTGPDVSKAKTPEEIARMVNTENPEPTEDDDESLAAAGNPFAKGEPTPDDSDSGGDFSEGDTVMLDGLDDVPMQVTGRTDSGDVVVEVTVSPDRLSIADEAMAAAAWQRFDERQQDRVRDSKLDKLTAAVEGLVASGQAQQETIAAQAAHIDTLQRERNSAEAQRLLASAGIGE